MTIVGKFGTGGIPALRNVPFNVRIVGQTTGGTANWVGQAKPKPLTKFHFAPTTLTWAKIAAISVISDELARFSVPGAEGLVRDALSETIVEKIDTDFIDPDVAVSADVSPASITNGVTPLSSAGTSADNIRSDIQNLLEQFILNNQRVTGLVLIMPETLALAASIMVNDLGQREFPDLEVGGGRLLGIPVITSQYAADEGTHGNLLIAVNAREVFLSDDGQVSIDVSREAALEMLDTGFTQSQPTGASLVSLWQNNLLGIKAERYINWKKRRAEAVSYMDDVNWGSVGSPA
jgi:HK97 family phage major capsid protein